VTGPRYPRYYQVGGTRLSVYCTDRGQHDPTPITKQTVIGRGDHATVRWACPRPGCPCRARLRGDTTAKVLTVIADAGLPGLDISLLPEYIRAARLSPA
jgi:hypothetical protein